MADNLKIVNCKTDGYEPDKDGNFCCDYEGCGYKTDSRAKFGQHLRYHRKNKHVKLSGEAVSVKSAPRYEMRGGKWCCKICGKEFDRKRACAAHLGFHSIKNGEFKCSVCGRIFTRANALASHLRVHRKGKSKAKVKEPETILPMALEIEGGSEDQTFEVPIIIKIRISVEAKC